MYTFSAYNPNPGPDTIFNAAPTLSIAYISPAYTNSTTASFQIDVANNLTPLAQLDTKFLLNGNPVTPGTPGQ